MTDTSPFIKLAIELADTVRPIVMGYFRGAFDITAKDDASPVTVADREAEAAMRKRINAAFPEHGILGEEFGSERMDAEYIWVLDPIDGTHSFVTGKPLFGTLISLTRGGVPIVGVIDMPALNERWVGGEGRPTTWNASPVNTRPCATLKDAWLYATTPDMFVGDNATAFERVKSGARRTGFGADCYAYGLLASGYVDAVVEASLGTYDYCALAPVVIGAGGVMTDWQGGALNIQSDGRVIATGDKALHAEIVKTLAG